jgi:G3E family GTPase
MLRNIPTHVIGGPLGAGKTSLIRHLLANKPADERWAVLINEFGQVGLDAALLTTAADGIALGEVAGGCLCCVNGVPFQIGLSRLLRKARPDRLLIEPSGLGHPAQLMAQLREAPWRGVLSVQPSVIVLDAPALVAGQPLSASQQDALAEAGLLVMNKSDALDVRSRGQLADRFKEHSLAWASHGQVEGSLLPGFTASIGQAVDNSPVDNLSEHEGTDQLPTVWLNPREPLCFSHAGEGGWSVGWRWHPSQRFDLTRLQQWLEGEEWVRAKLVVQGQNGWVSANAVEGAHIVWRPSEWRRDSRLELIFSTPRAVAPLQAILGDCRI